MISMEVVISVQTISRYLSSCPGENQKTRTVQLVKLWTSKIHASLELQHLDEAKVLRHHEPTYACNWSLLKINEPNKLLFNLAITVSEFLAFIYHVNDKTQNCC
jgi:hypothetical protein